MASIVFDDFLAYAVPLPDDMKAIQGAASYFNQKGHRTTVVTSFPEREHAYVELPDVLVVDMVFCRYVDLVNRLLAHRQASLMPGLIVIADVRAELGATIPNSQPFLPLIDSYIIRPYYCEMTDEQRRNSRIHLSFQEQMVVSVEHLLYRRGLMLPAEEPD